MTPKELADALQSAFDQGLDSVPLVLARRPMPRGMPRGRRVHLAGRSSPLGEVMTVNHEGRIVARFDAVEVAAWATSIGVLSAYVVQSQADARAKLAKVRQELAATPECDCGMCLACRVADVVGA